MNCSEEEPSPGLLQDFARHLASSVHGNETEAYLSFPLRQPHTPQTVVNGLGM